MDANNYTLKSRLRVERDSHFINSPHRVYFTPWWLNHDERTDGDFIFLWFTFTAAPAAEIDDSNRLSKQSALVGLLNIFCEQGPSGSIEKAVWLQCLEAIRSLLDAPYALKSFEDLQDRKDSREKWPAGLEKGKTSLAHALSSRDASGIVDVLFSCLFTQRAGGEAHGRGVTRLQQRDCKTHQDKREPLVTSSMMNNPALYGEVRSIRF